MNDERLRELLADSLALWRVAGVVESGEAPAAAVIRGATGTLVWIERPATRDVPFRWLVRWRGAGEAPGSAREQRPKACASLVGMLGAVRGALGVERGSAIRIAPASDP